MKEFKQLGSYGLIIENNKILLIKKSGGPYDGKLDLPGGTIEFMERPEDTLIRELKEEVGIDVTNYELLDTDSITVDWYYKEEIIKVHHIGVFYKILNYNNELLKDISIDSKNDDSKGAEYYEISKLRKSELSSIAILEIEKLGYILSD